MTTQDILRAAYAAHSEALNLPWPNSSQHAVGNALLNLRDELKPLEDLTNGEHWQTVYPDLTGPEPEDQAWEMAEQNVVSATADLRRLMNGMRSNETKTTGVAA